MSDIKTKIVIETKDLKVYHFISKLTKTEIGEKFNYIYKETSAHHIGFMYENGSDCYLPTYLLNESIITLTDYNK